MQILMHKCLVLVEATGLEAVREVAESLTNKGNREILPQNNPKTMIKIN